jgi:hypothetical protein
MTVKISRGVPQMKRANVLAVILAFAAVGTLSSVALAQGPYGGNQGRGGMMGGGMMGGYGLTPGQTITPTLPFGSGWGWGMMGGWGYNGAPGASTITVDQAVTNMENYVSSLGNADLKLREVEEYSLNFYGVVQEKSTGTNAFQLIENKSNGAVYPEMGPNMMWNTKYSPMAWMMGGAWFGSASGKMTVSTGRARTNATDFLKQYLPSTTLESSTDTFYGYYNMDVLQDAKTYGMLSVNGYTGVVWYHTWHGEFIAAKGLD